MWGENFYGQLGFGDRPDRKTPQHLSIEAKCVRVKCGGFHSVAQLG